MKRVTKQRELFVEDRPLVYLNDYQRLALETDKNQRKGLDGLRLPLLGLFGETGTLVSALKRRRRDRDSYVGYAASVLEEFGDTLWYFSNIASRADLELSVLAKRVFRQIENWDNVKANEFGRFRDIQRPRRFSGPLAPQKFESAVLRLSGHVGLLIHEFELGKINGNRDHLSASLVEIFRALIAAAEAGDVSLEKAAYRNLNKIFDRWPQKKDYAPLFDRLFPKLEQLPRRITLRFLEVKSGKRTYVIQQCNGVNIGDRLTDNKLEEDDYRFHDVFHLAYAAILGWSPVLRSLLRVKRKSNPKTDEIQDGARALIIEEGISTWVFNYGLRLNCLRSAKSVDYELLNLIQEFVAGYEVERCPPWQWQEAILEGFKCFRALKKHRRGEIEADLNHRTIKFHRI